MNICCTVNEKFLRPLKTLLVSLAETQTEKIDLYLLNYYLTENEIKEISTFSNVLDIRFHLIPFPDRLFQKLKKEATLDEKGGFTIEVFFRLFIPQLLPNTVSRVLFLDADIIVIKDLSFFYHKPFEENYAIGTKDIMTDLEKWEENLKNRKEKLEMKKESTYFNAGSLILNLEKIRKDPDFSEKNLFKLIKEKDFGFHDQDILNFLLRDRVYIFQAYEFNCPPYYMSEDLNAASILHYTGRKPWEVRENNYIYSKLIPYHNKMRLLSKFENLIEKLNKYENSNNINM